MPEAEKCIVIPHGFEVNYTVGFVKGLLANDIRPLVVSCDDTHDALIGLGASCVNLRGSNDEDRRSVEKMANLLLYYYRLSLLVLRFRPNAIHFTGIFRNEFVLFEAFYLGMLFKLSGARFVYTVHNTLPHSKTDSRLFRWVYRCVYRFPDFLLANTQRSGSELIDCFDVPSRRVKRFSLGLNEVVPVKGISREEARAKIGLSVTNRVVLFFGKIDEYKGLDLLLKAAKDIPLENLKLVVAGTYRSSSYKERVQELFKSPDLEGKLVLREEFIPNEEIEIYFKASDVLCLPYRNIYQSGLVFLSPVFGVPIVASDVGSMAEYVTPEVGILFERENVADLTRALKSYFANSARFKPDEIRELGKRFDWGNVCGRITDLYSIGDPVI
ncbi:glycosyltransferase family 4 protein [Pelagicoccus sp. SDUM812003]|uniref:glycosyltransferase family 4 protein n=1 Tax=Pelagicoccus sp. SDUM812003 TaxID=3041267 RepID=UPI00280CC582|nr:glycosyltransferase family 4 protein [Pelagicoccus sp. SDUM812003]MDQ8205005.1 glycosyltransferase family 4 protein [Pelagicoccus sp. SDUM812003]